MAPTPKRASQPRRPGWGGQLSSATGEERRQEVEEIPGVDDAVLVEVGIGSRGEEGGEEVEEVLRVERAVGVEVGEAPARPRSSRQGARTRRREIGRASCRERG